MKNSFIGYYIPSDAEFDALWAACLFVFDANALLNLYRYSQSTKDDFLDLLDALKGRLWLPHQAGLEFFRNRPAVIRKQLRAYEKLDEASRRSKEAIQEIMQEYRYHPAIDATEFARVIDTSFDPINTYLVRAKRSHPDYSESDPILSKVMELFEKKVGPPYSDQRRNDIFKEATGRYEREVPPGYMDRSKDEPKKFGDFIIWKQILEHATAQKVSVILITDDKKDDWWWREGGLGLGPRPELISEFHAVTGGVFYAYPPDQFMERARTYTGSKIKDSSVNEARAISVRGDQIVSFEESEQLARQWAYDRQSAIFALRRLIAGLEKWTTETAPSLFEDSSTPNLTPAELDSVNARIDRYWTLVNTRMEAADLLQRIEYNPTRWPPQWKEQVSAMTAVFKDPTYSTPYPQQRIAMTAPRD